MSLRILLLLVVLGAENARAFVASPNAEGALLRWILAATPPFVPTNSVNTNTHAIRYFIASDGFSTTNTAAEINSVRACFDQWQAIPGTSLKFEDAGLIAPDVDVNTGDATNVIFWAKSSTRVGGTNGYDIFGALGVTFTSFSSENILTEADIVMNGVPGGAGFDSKGNPVSANWFTDILDTNNPNYFVEGTLLHEIGHFIGLRHSPVGGATMLAVGGNTSKAVQIGLSEDEFAAARYLYPPAAPASLGTLKGAVTDLTDFPLLGAAVIAENSAGNIVSGTVARADGSYLIPALPPGSYNIRVTPLDPAGAQFGLIRGSDIDADFQLAHTDFLPSAITPVTLTGGATNTLNFAMTTETPAFYASHIRPPTNNPAGFSIVNSPVSIRPGQSNLTTGVFGTTLPTNGVSLTITGDGITLGPITYNPNLVQGLNAISVLINVASNATPGLRSFVINHTNDAQIAYVNGFLEVSPLTVDANFDGLDDAFQRKYFPLFTAPQAGPAVDADGDGYTNLAEYIAGSNPTNSASFLQIQSVTQNSSGTTINWSSEAGKKYRVLSRAQIAGSAWTTNTVSPVIGTGATTQYTDSPLSGAVKFYRVQAVP